jgi:hypothetical protein
MNLSPVILMLQKGIKIDDTLLTKLRTHGLAGDLQILSTLRIVMGSMTDLDMDKLPREELGILAVKREGSVEAL